MKKWVQKLVEQIDFRWGRERADSREHLNLSDDRATLLYIIDILNNHLIEVDSHTPRAVREQLDRFAKEIIETDDKDIEKVLFKFRQYFGSYRIAEFSYIQTTFDDFRRIILDFVEQLGEDLSDERKEDLEIKGRIDQLHEAIQSNSIDVLKSESRSFIDAYVQIQSKKEKRRTKRAENVRKNLDVVKKQLSEAHNEMKFDHLTGANNRRSFDDQMRKLCREADEAGKHVTLVTLDIDHFKKVNDCYGHDIGDFCLQECVKMLRSVFGGNHDFVARIGGEEFAILLPNHTVEQAVKRVENAMTRIRNETFIKGDIRFNFTVSMGIAQRMPHEKPDSWLKRADRALYQSKNGGRNRYTVAP
ncbi:MAG TPA: GGDEF domain-containing protein, partial [Bdellovibrionales bacterium]|nr:GGDEF domain-containing protein [Bdellovibrionales bacterium]